MKVFKCEGCGEVYLICIASEDFDQAEHDSKFASHQQKHGELEAML